MNAPRLVCLDAADTLFTERATRAELYAECFVARGHAVTAERMDAWMERAHAELSRPDAPQPRYSRAWFRAFVARLLHSAGADDDPELLRAALEERFTRPETYEVFGDVWPCLEALHERGLRLAVVSNWSDRLPGLLQALGLARYFEELAVSAVVGFDKPDPRLFRWLLTRMDVAPEHALHVGDHPVNDVLGARRAGLRGVHLDRAASAPSGGDVLRELTELPALLDG